MYLTTFIFAQIRVFNHFDGENKELVLLSKRITSLLMVLMLLFIFCGCDTDYIAEPSNNDAQVVSDDVVKENVDNNAETEQESISQTPGKPREDLEVEVAPGITSNCGLMRVHFIDVGQADSAFIELGNGQTMLIDAGRSGNASTIINYIKGLQYETIDYVVASHPHDDHIGGMATVLDNFNIGKMYMPKQAHTITAFTNMLFGQHIKREWHRERYWKIWDMILKYLVKSRLTVLFKV